MSRICKCGHEWDKHYNQNDGTRYECLKFGCTCGSFKERDIRIPEEKDWDNPEDEVWNNKDRDAIQEEE